MTDLKTLLVPVDGSEGANAAARYAGTLARRLSVPVRLLFAFPASPVEMFGLPYEYVPNGSLRYFSPEAFDELRKETAARAFSAARDALGENVEVSEVLLSGDAAESIVGYADGLPAATIVMGRRGLSRLREMMIGSVSQGVVHSARCPVVLVR